MLKMVTRYLIQSGTPIKKNKQTNKKNKKNRSIGFQMVGMFTMNDSLFNYTKFSSCDDFTHWNAVIHILNSVS